MEWLHLGELLWDFSEFHSVDISCQQVFQVPRAGQGEENNPRWQSAILEGGAIMKAGVRQPWLATGQREGPLGECCLRVATHVLSGAEGIGCCSFCPVCAAFLFLAGGIFLHPLGDPGKWGCGSGALSLTPSS